MGDGGALSHVSRLVSYALLYLGGDRTDTMRGTAGRRTWDGAGRASLKDRCVACNNMDLRFLI